MRVRVFVGNQVRQGPCPQPHSRGPVLEQGVRGDLDDRGPQALVRHGPQPPLQGDGVRGGQARGHPCGAEEDAQGTDGTGRTAAGLEKLAQEQCRRGLAHGPRYAHHGQLMGRIAEPPGGQARQGEAAVAYLHRHTRPLAVGQALRYLRPVHHHGVRPPEQGLIDEVVAIPM